MLASKSTAPLMRTALAQIFAAGSRKISWVPTASSASTPHIPSKKVARHHSMQRSTQSSTVHFNSLAASGTLAVVGATPDSSKPVFALMESLIDEGYDVIPVNYGVAKQGGLILGRKAVASVAEVEGSAKIVDIFNEENPYYLPV